MTYLRPAGDLPGAGLDAALDFVNTTGLSNGHPFEDLPTSHDALHWLVEHGLLAPDEALAEQERLALHSTGERELQRLKAVRAGLRELIDAIDEDRAPSADAVAAVNGALATRERTLLVQAAGGLRLERQRDGTPLDRALAELARRIASEFDGGRPERFRVCGNDRCRWAFYDRSRPGSRRWCEMASCGNRMKAARHRARQKAAQGSPAADG